MKKSGGFTTKIYIIYTFLKKETFQENSRKVSPNRFSEEKPFKLRLERFFSNNVRNEISKS